MLTSRFNLILYLILLLLLSSCSHGDTNLLTYSVSSRDFEDILTIDGFVEPVKSTTLVCPRDLEGTITFIVEDGTYVEEGDVVCTIEMKELQTSYDELQTSLENAEADLSKTIADLNLQYALLEAQVKNNDADTKIAALDSLQLAYLTPSQRKIKELELEKVSIEKIRYDKKLQALRVIQQSEIKKQELGIQRFHNRIQYTKDRLEELTLRSPQKGMAIRSRNFMTWQKNQVGDLVWSNMPLVIIPELAQMKVKILASEKDFKLISVNDSIHYTFDAMPDHTAWGKILKKAPIGQPQKQGSKVKFFEIEASVDSMTALPEPGFTANCRILLKQVKDTIVIPQIAIFEEDSMKVVFVKRNKSYEMRQIQTGLSSPKEAVVSSGLRRKETIALTRPPSSMLKGTSLLSDSIAKRHKLMKWHIDSNF